MVYGLQEHWKTLPESTTPIAMETKYGDEGLFKKVTQRYFVLDNVAMCSLFDAHSCKHRQHRRLLTSSDSLNYQKEIELGFI